MPENFDYLVIGGGSGGIASARRAAQHGARVAVVESARLGGTCVNVGCVPKKLMWHAGQLAHGFADAPDYGFRQGAWSLDWATLVQRREDYLRRLNGIYANNLERDGVTVYTGQARFASDREIRVGEHALNAAKILIATGGRPHWPDLPGADLGLDSDGFFALRERPRRVAVVGSGYIAVELAGVLAALGSEVHLVFRHAQVLRHFDPLLSEILLENMAAAGVVLHPHSVPKALRGQPGELVLETAGGDAVACEQLIWAIGRHPNTADLGLELAGVACDDQGHIEVDAAQHSSQSHIYALGDVTRAPALTPVAVAAGRRLADQLFAGAPVRPIDPERVPTVVFSHPPIGTVGLSEAAAVERFGVNNVRVYQSRFRALYYGMLEHKVQSAVKLVCQGPDDVIVGLHSIGPGSDELLQGFAVALNMGATKADFDATIAIHPTVSEELVTLR